MDKHALQATPNLSRDLCAAERYLAATRSPSTRRAYRANWARFVAYADKVGARAIPADPALVAAYLAHLMDSGLRVSSMRVAVAAIAAAHVEAGLKSPTEHVTVRRATAGIRRTHGTAQRRVRPLSVAEVRSMADVLIDGRGARGLRDRALLLVGFAGALRVSELVGLDVEDLVWEAEGVRVRVRRSKTDQDARGRCVGIPHGHGDPRHCPVRALRVWLGVRGDNTGAIFRGILASGEHGKRLDCKAVRQILKGAAGAIGLDASQVSSHSLRAGLVTEAARAGCTESQIMRQTGHRSVSVLRTYIRHATIWDNNPVEGLY
jgi:integrase